MGVLKYKNETVADLVTMVQGADLRMVKLTAPYNNKEGVKREAKVFLLELKDTSLHLYPIELLGQDSYTFIRDYYGRHDIEVPLSLGGKRLKDILTTGEYTTTSMTKALTQTMYRNLIDKYLNAVTSENRRRDMNVTNTSSFISRTHILAPVLDEPANPLVKAEYESLKPFYTSDYLENYMEWENNTFDVYGLEYFTNEEAYDEYVSSLFGDDDEGVFGRFTSVDAETGVDSVIPFRLQNEEGKELYPFTMTTTANFHIKKEKTLPLALSYPMFVYSSRIVSQLYLVGNGTRHTCVTDIRRALLDYTVASYINFMTCTQKAVKEGMSGKSTASARKEMLAFITDFLAKASSALDDKQKQNKAIKEFTEGYKDLAAVSVLGEIFYVYYSVIVEYFLRICKFYTFLDRLAISPDMSMQSASTEKLLKQYEKSWVAYRNGDLTCPTRDSVLAMLEEEGFSERVMSNRHMVFITVDTQGFSDIFLSGLETEKYVIALQQLLRETNIADLRMESQTL